MENLKEIYKEWRELNAELDCSSDCGEARNREDFSRFAGLTKTISFEEMLKLERDY